MKIDMDLAKATLLQMKARVDEYTNTFQTVYDSFESSMAPYAKQEMKDVLEMSKSMQELNIALFNSLATSLEKLDEALVELRAKK